MSTHTPGPWTVKGSSGDGKRIFVESDMNRDNWECCRCEVDSDDCDTDMAKANAALIAAAPELLNVAMFFADCLHERSAKDRDTAAFRARWSIPIEVSLDEFSRTLVAAAIAKATKPASGDTP